MIAKNIFSKILFFLGILIFTSCVSDDVVFNQVGYFKDDMKNRVFTFRIISQKASFSSDSIPQNVLNKIEEHGKSQMHTARQITNCYYFLENAPDVTMKDDFFFCLKFVLG